MKIFVSWILYPGYSILHRENVIKFCLTVYYKKIEETG